MAKLLDFLRHRGTTAFSEFIRALVTSEQDPIALTLDVNEAKRLISIRDQENEVPVPCPDSTDDTDDIDGKIWETIKPIGNYLLCHPCWCKCM